jgi:hypothetical protein
MADIYTNKVVLTVIAAALVTIAAENLLLLAAAQRERGPQPVQICDSQGLQCLEPTPIFRRGAVHYGLPVSVESDR